MLILISPAKTLDFESQVNTVFHTIPDHLDKSKQLIAKLKKLKPKQLVQLMNISHKLAQLNFERFQLWDLDQSVENTKQAVFAFKGDVYQGFEIQQFSENDLKYTQDHLRILSGLHGLLRPMDLIQPYRLEMGTPIGANRKKNLYDFWGDSITSLVKQQLTKTNSSILVNLASEEYFKSINTDQLEATVVTPVFKDFKNGTYKFLSVYGKKARGMMARYILKNKIEDVNQLKLFEEEGYFYNEKLSSALKPVFTRG